MMFMIWLKSKLNAYKAGTEKLFLGYLLQTLGKFFI